MYKLKVDFFLSVNIDTPEKEEYFMVFALILIILIIVFVAFFIGKNIDYTCTLWLFQTFENKPVSVMILIAFAAGILFALISILLVKLNKSINSRPEPPVAQEKPVKIKKPRKSLLKKAEKIQVQTPEQELENK